MSTQVAGGVIAEWSELANLLAGVVRTERRQTIEECIAILRAHPEAVEALRLMEEARGRV